MSATEVIEQFKALPASERAQVASLSWKMMIPGALNLSGKARPMREPGDLSTWIQRSMSRIPVINEISFPRDSGYSR